MAALVALSDTSRMGNIGMPGETRQFGTLGMTLLVCAHVCNRIWADGPESAASRLQLAIAAVIAIIGAFVALMFRIPWPALLHSPDRVYYYGVLDRPEFLLAGAGIAAVGVGWFAIASRKARAQGTEGDENDQSFEK